MKEQILREIPEKREQCVKHFELTEKEMDCIRRMDTGIPMIGNPENPLKTEAAMKW